MSDKKHYWLIDRSRYQLGLQECLFKRYLQYHAGPNGLGYVPKNTSLPLSTGTMIHGFLEIICLNLKVPLESINTNTEINKTWTPEVIQEFIAKNQIRVKFEKYRTELLKTQVSAEQLWLAECIGWFFLYWVWPLMANTYAIVFVEEELKELFKVTKDLTIVQMSRPDLIVYNKLSKEFEVHDFKSASMLGNHLSGEFDNSLQMTIGCYLGSFLVGQPIKRYAIHSFNKGRHVDGKQQSPFCYAKIKALPSGAWVATDAKTWIEKSPVWEHFNNPELWVKNELSSITALKNLYAFVGPYNIKEEVWATYVEGMPEHEKGWIYNLTLISEGASPDKLIPRSYKCYNFGSRCSMYDLCMFGNASGYVEREPHHTLEKQLKFQTQKEENNAVD